MSTENSTPETTEQNEKATRVHVPLKDFLRVTVKQRDTITTAQAAADALGYTSLESFKQALGRIRKRYPETFASVPKYTTSNGPSIATKDEVASIMAELDAEDSQSSEGEGSGESAE